MIAGTISSSDQQTAVTETQTFTIKKGKSRIVVVGMVSEEYPQYTGDQSEWNDQLEWEITPSVGDAVEDSVDVNNLHNEWDLANFEGTTLQGFSPAHMKKISVIHAPGEADVTVTVKLTVTNIGDEFLPSTLIIGLIPVEVADNRFATGVDNVSKTADSSDLGYQEDFWIMAPSGSPPSGGDCENDTKIFIPVDNSVDLLIDPDKATADPDTIDLVTEDDSNTDADETLNKVTWHGTSDESGENVIEWEFGPNEPEENLLPIKVMTMKNRTVDVAVHLVNTVHGESVEMINPHMIPSEQEIEAHLYEIFATQINAWFKVKMDKNADGTLKFYEVDSATDQVPSFNFLDPEVTSVDQQKTLDEVGNLVDQKIRVFLIANQGTFVVGNAAFAYGVTNRSAATCWVLGSQTGSNVDVKNVLSTIGHEIGHVLVGYGHPDDGEAPGPAPLVGTDQTVRLMCRHQNRSLEDGRLLVKSEWEAAEEWLSVKIDPPQP